MFLSVLLATVLSLCFVAEVHAQTPSTANKPKPLPSDGHVCIGYNPLAGEWLSPPGDDNKRWFTCPPHYAFFGVRNPQGRAVEAEVGIHGNCCRLPNDDILTKEHVEVDAYCPEGYIVTGSFVLWHTDRRRPMRCTKINTSRYALGPRQTGIAWGLGTALAFPWTEKKVIRLDEIPLAVRYGITRETRVTRLMNGCVGEPVGSLLVGKKSSQCKGTIWRQLFYRDKNKRSSWKPVKMFPNCQRIDDPYSPYARCVERKDERDAGETENVRK